ncbi:hypothetical protein GCM10023223_45220 [Stackebrandtia albiflava]
MAAGPIAEFAKPNTATSAQMPGSQVTSPRANNAAAASSEDTTMVTFRPNRSAITPPMRTPAAPPAPNRPTTIPACDSDRCREPVRYSINTMTTKPAALLTSSAAQMYQNARGSGARVGVRAGAATGRTPLNCRQRLYDPAVAARPVRRLVRR